MCRLAICRHCVLDHEHDDAVPEHYDIQKQISLLSREIGRLNIGLRRQDGKRANKTVSRIKCLQKRIDCLEVDAACLAERISWLEEELITLVCILCDNTLDVYYDELDQIWRCQPAQPVDDSPIYSEDEWMSLNAGVMQELAADRLFRLRAARERGVRRSAPGC